MKKLLILGAILVATIYTIAQAPNYFWWNWRGHTIYIYDDASKQKLQLGLRHDGVVIWREVKTETDEIINSPAENGRFHIIAPREVRLQTNNGIFYPPTNTIK